jgi:hypothetical protein
MLKELIPVGFPLLRGDFVVQHLIGTIFPNCQCCQHYSFFRFTTLTPMSRTVFLKFIPRVLNLHPYPIND